MNAVGPGAERSEKSPLPRPPRRPCREADTFEACTDSCCREELGLRSEREAEMGDEDRDLQETDDTEGQGGRFPLGETEDDTEGHVRKR